MHHSHHQNNQTHIQDQSSWPLTPISPKTTHAQSMPSAVDAKRYRKVVVSTLSAETMSLNATLDKLSWIRLFWGWLLNPNLNWKRPKETLNNLPTTIAAPTFKPIEPSIAVTDCKSLYDLVTRTAPPSCQEYRTQLLARSIKDLLSEGITLRWVHSGAQLADALTKVMQATFLRQTLELGTYKLHDEHAILKDRASARSQDAMVAVKCVRGRKDLMLKFWECELYRYPKGFPGPFSQTLPSSEPPSFRAQPSHAADTYGLRQPLGRREGLCLSHLHCRGRHSVS